MLRSLLPCGALCVSALSLGCAEMTYGPKQRVDETVISTRQKIVPSVSGPATSFKQTGTEIHITARLKCDVVEEKEVRVTYEQERENPALVPELVLLGFGAVPAGLGVAFLIDAPNVYSDDRNARQYNASGKTGAIAAGVVMLAWGTAMMAVPMVDFVRAWTSKEEEITAIEQGRVIRAAIPCEAGVGGPLALAQVQGRAAQDAFALGQTDSSGVFMGDLAAIVPSRIFESSNPPTTMDVFINNTFVGKVSLSGVDDIQRKERKRGDDEAWGRVDVIACRSAVTPDHPACAEVRSYVMTFPNGERIQEARRLLDPTTRSGSVQVAASPEDIAKAEAERKKAEAERKKAEAAAEAARKAAADATEAAKKAASEACRKKCEAACKKDAACAKGCVEGACQ